MSISLLLKSVATSIQGSLFRTKLITDMTAIETAVNANEVQLNALQATAGVSAWSPGGTYAVGEVVYSPTNFLNYRNKTGAVGVDPAGDATNWESMAQTAVEINAGAAETNPTDASKLGFWDSITGTLKSLTFAALWGKVNALIEARLGDFSLDTGTNNAKVVALNPPIAAYTQNFCGAFRNSVENTGATTVDFGGGAIPLVTNTGTALSAGDLPSGAIVGYQYIHNDAKAYLVSMVPSQTLDPLDTLDLSFFKTDPLTPAFTKTGADTISIKAGTVIMVFGIKMKYLADTAITMPALTAGTDYAIYACTDGTIRADASFVAPAGYTANNSRMIGGFHYGLVAAGTTVAGGAFATAGNGMIWTQGDVDNIAGINKYSIWDLKFRPAASDPSGMVLVDGEVWVDIYLASTDTDANGTSKYNTNIASGTVLPKIPTAFGGNGTTTYPSLNWWVANELARAKQKRLMFADEFATAMFGVTENQSIDATASTYPTTQRNTGYTSKYGIEQASGHHWVWGQDSNFYSEAASPAGTWKQVNGNTGAAGSQRGETYTFGTYGLARVILGGARANGASSGSRASNWHYFPWDSYWSVGVRAACDHMISV